MRELDSFVSELQYTHICSTFCLQWELIQQCTKAQLLPRTFLMQNAKYHSQNNSRISYVGKMKLSILEFSQATQNYNPYSVRDTSHSFSVKFHMKNSFYNEVYSKICVKNHCSNQDDMDKDQWPSPNTVSCIPFVFLGGIPGTSQVQLF